MTRANCTLDGAGVAAGASDAVRDFTYHERQFLKALDYECVRFLVVGSWASDFHGLVLDPADLDVLIGTDPGNAQVLPAGLELGSCGTGQLSADTPRRARAVQAESRHFRHESCRCADSRARS